MNTPRLHLATDVDSNLHRPVDEKVKSPPSQNVEVMPPGQEVQPTTQQPEAIAPASPVASTPTQQQTAAVATTAAAQSVSPQSQQVHTDSTTARELFKKSIEQLEADDVDLIEKPWVDKTEEIIEKEKDDPSAEDEYQNQISTAYLKKRFNLDIN